MSKTRNELKQHILDRALFEGWINEVNPLKTVSRRLLSLDIDDVLDNAIEAIYIRTRQGHRDSEDKVSLGILSLEVGKGLASRAIRNYTPNCIPDKKGKTKLLTPNQAKSANSLTGTAVKLGAFIIYSFEKLGLVDKVETQDRNKHSNYFIQASVKGDRKLTNLRNTIDKEKSDKFPKQDGPYPDWKGPYNSGYRLIKTQEENLMGHTKEVISGYDEVTGEPTEYIKRHHFLNPKDYPVMFQAVNDSQKIGWRINLEMMEVFDWALAKEEAAFGDIWSMTNPQAKQSKLREAEAILNTAENMGEDTFYHLYYYDFRGRKYPATAYLHEQGTDGAKGMLLMDHKKPLGSSGLFWMMVNAANHWAGKSNNPPDENGEVPKTDKIPIQDRYDFALDKWEDEWSEWAVNPMINKGWMEADKPWQFLSTIIELRRAVESGDPLNYETGFVVYIDGTNNGCQHLSALTMDEVTGEQVNVSGTNAPYAGDLYAYVANAVWANSDKSIEPDLKLACDKFIDKLLEIKTRITELQFEIKEKGIKYSDTDNPLIKEKDNLIKKSRKLRENNQVISDETCKVFWSRITDKKERRKIVKRNVMTLPYGGTEYGLGEQQIKDARKHSIDLLTELEHKWGSYMGRHVFASCQEAIPKPMKMLEIFEIAGSRAEDKKESLSWNVPGTNFPVVQHYMEGTVKRVNSNYGDEPESVKFNKRLFRKDHVRFSVAHKEIPRMSPGKQKQGASPNIIHSLDASHLAMTQMACKDAGFDLITVHDSFGSHPSDMQDLFDIVRVEFKNLYELNPLENLLKQLGIDDIVIERGDLDLNDILENEFAFS